MVAQKPKKRQQPVYAGEYDDNVTVYYYYPGRGYYRAAPRYVQPRYVQPQPGWQAWGWAPPPRPRWVPGW